MAADADHQNSQKAFSNLMQNQSLAQHLDLMVKSAQA